MIKANPRILIKFEDLSRLNKKVCQCLKELFMFELSEKKQFTDEYDKIIKKNLNSQD